MTYTPNQVLIDSSSTTVPTSITLEQSGIYELRLVGGGGGGHYYFYMNDNFTNYGTYYASGGSGSAFWGQVYLEAGTYTVQLGTGGSTGTGASNGTSGDNSIFGSCVGYGGTAGYINGNTKTSPSSVVAGSGGNTPSIVGCEVISIEMLEAGNNGRTGGGAGDQSQTKVYGGSSVYGSDVGAGGGFNDNTDGAGYDGLIYLKFVTALEESEHGSDSESQGSQTVFTKKSLSEMPAVTTNYYKYTVPNGIIQGTLTNTNGVLSGFSSSNYLDILTRFANNSQPYEIKFKVTTGNDITNNQAILCDRERSNDILAIWMREGKFHLFMSSDNVGTYDVQTNTTYYIKVIDDGNTTKLYYSLDDVTYIEDISTATRIDSSVHFAVGTEILLLNYDTFYWRGSIDLKESYIKINGKIWWCGLQLEKGTSENYDLYTESYSYKTYGKEETYDETVYGDDIWSSLIDGPASSTAEMVCWTNTANNEINVLSTVSNNYRKSYYTTSEALNTWNTGIMYTGQAFPKINCINNYVGNGNDYMYFQQSNNWLGYFSINGGSYTYCDSNYINQDTVNAPEVVLMSSKSSVNTLNDSEHILCIVTMKVNGPDSIDYEILKGIFAPNVVNYIDFDLEHKTVDGGYTANPSFLINETDYKAIILNDTDKIFLILKGDYDTVMTSSSSSTADPWVETPIQGEIHKQIIVGGEYYNGVYYLLHSDGKISCSMDGITWKIKGPISNTLTSEWDGLARVGSGNYANLVAINRNGKIAYISPSEPTTVEKTRYNYKAYYGLPDSSSGGSSSEQLEIAWVQPTLDANGTLGGDSFAVQSSGTLSPGASEAYHAFDNNPSTYWHSPANMPQYLTFYNPKPLKVTGIEITNYSAANNYNIKTGTIYASNDNSNWVSLGNWTCPDSSQGAGAKWNIDLSSNMDFYKYYKIYVSTCTYYTGGKYYAIIAQADITASYLA